MNALHPIQDNRSATPRSHAGQFITDESPPMPVCMAGLVHDGMEDLPLSSMARVVSLSPFIVLLYRFIYLRRVRYRAGEEQLVSEHGIFIRRVDYMELHRIADFQEHQSLLQQICELKTVRILSMDRDMPRLDLIGIRRRDDIVATIRERVEINKRKKGIYEITNRQYMGVCCICRSVPTTSQGTDCCLKPAGMGGVGRGQ